MPMECWKLAQLPLRLGGLRLTSTGVMADVCYAASLRSSLSLIHGLLHSITFPQFQLIQSSLRHAADIHGLPSHLQAPAILPIPRTSHASFPRDYQHLATDALTDKLRRSLRPPPLPSSAPQHFLKRLDSVCIPSAIRPISTVPQTYLGNRVAESLAYCYFLPSWFTDLLGCYALLVE